ncbi:MAG: hypothetical protein ACMUIM_01345 [bacterium]
MRSSLLILRRLFPCRGLCFILCLLLLCGPLLTLESFQRNYLPEYLCKLFLTMSPLPCPAYASDLVTISGYVKNFSMVFDEPDAMEDGNGSPIGAVNTRLRLKLAVRPDGPLNFHAAYDLSPRIQDPSLFKKSPYPFAMDPSSYRVEDFDTLITPKGENPDTSFGLYHNLDRFFLTLQYGFGDIYIGRQAIAWGSAHMINPTDILAPFSFTELDQEERFGVDALRIRVPISMMSELDMGYVFGKDFSSREHAFFIRGKGYHWRTDMAVLLMGFKEHAMVGIDLTRSIGGAGVWLEAAYVKPEFFRDSNAPADSTYDDTAYTRISIGMDGSLNEKLYGFVEYHFNSAGASSPEGYQDLFSTPAYRDGAVYLIGEHYLCIGGNYQLHPLAPMNANLLYNLQDHSLSFSPQIEYNIAEDIYIAAGATLGIGKRPAGPGDPRLRSEFGAYPDMYWASFRIYF